MDVGTEGWKVYAVGDNRIKEIVKRQEDSVEIELEESAQNPIYWFRNKDDIIASIKKLVGFGSTRFQEFMNRVDAIEAGHKESSTKLTDLNNDMLVAIMKEATPESWANLMLAATEPIPADQRESVVGLDGISYTPKYRRNSSLWEANKHVIEKNCNEFLQNNRQSDDENFCRSKTPLHKICRHRTNRCNRVYNFNQYEVIPIPGQTGAYRIKDGVTSIVREAFQFDMKMRSLSIPDSVTEIGKWAFANCLIKSVKISKSVTVIPLCAFRDSKLESVIIPNSVTHIEEYAFRRCISLETVKLSEKLTRIGDSAFSYCESLKSVIIPDSVTHIEESVFHRCISLETVKLPESLTFIGRSAFQDCESLKSVIIPDSVKRIDHEAFRYCMSLETIKLPESLTFIGHSAFRYCKSLKSVTIPQSVKSISYCVFKECRNLQSVTIPESIKVIEERAFDLCESLKSVTIPESVEIIEVYAFRYCSNLTSVTFPESIIKINKEAFWGCDKLDKATRDRLRSIQRA